MIQPMFERGHYRFEYFNHRDDKEVRTVVIRCFEYGSNEYYPEPQWFVRAYCLDRKAERTFALNRITLETVEQLL